MYTELIKIIEGGLSKDVKKVASYAQHLANRLREDGEHKLSEKIVAALRHSHGVAVYKDELFETPVDADTRLDIATVIMPSDIQLDISVHDSIRHSISEFVKLAKSKRKLQQSGLDINLSLLLYGPPGCGKTSIAKFVAKELDMPLITARFDSLISSLLGNTAKNIRKLFDYAKSKPCILFLDEFDAIAKARDDQHEMGELKRVINSLLQNIDDFVEHNILIAATNHESLLDKAIWRRFEKIVKVEKPTTSEALDLIQFFFRKSLSKDISGDEKRLNTLASLFTGFSHSEIKKVINSSHYSALLNNRKQLMYEDILLELYRYQSNHSFKQDDAVKFLAEHGATQKAISDHLKISLRQVRNALTLEGNGR
jgi:SpoVK/Ycf46/Vps4 family AAA+-type ATPase